MKGNAMAYTYITQANEMAFVPNESVIDGVRFSSCHIRMSLILLRFLYHSSKPP